MDNELKRQILIDNYSNPVNKEVVNDQEYKYVNTNNSSCIDNIDLWMLIKDGIIKDIKFDGEACAISTASTSIMIKKLIGKSIDDAIEFITNFNNMIEDEEYDKELMGEALAFDEIYKQANRKTCASLPYRGIIKLLEEERGKDGEKK